MCDIIFVPPAKTQASVFDYIQRRLEAAKALLHSDKNLKDIAEEVGFSSALTMSRAFKRYEGTTPGRLRDLDNS